MERTIERHDAYRFGLPLLRNNGLVAHRAPGSEFFVKVVDAVDLVVGVNRERNAVQTFLAHDARETIRMIRLAGGTKNSFQNWLLTNAALFQGIQIALFTEGIAFHRIERLSTKFLMALETCETLDVVDHFHGGAATTLAHDLLATFVAHSEKVGFNGVLHALNE